MGGRGSSSGTANGMRNTRRKERTQPWHLSKEEIPQTPEETAAYLGVSVEEAKELYSAIKLFTGAESTDIREAQNGDSNDKAYLKLAADCERYIQVAPKWDGGTTYRGIEVSEELAATYQKGAIIDVNRGSASWSTSKKAAMTFGENYNGASVVFKCETQRNGTSVKHISEYTHENEVLVSKKSQYQVTGRHKEGKYLIVTVKEV